jgi:hypothetical protein
MQSTEPVTMVDLLSTHLIATFWTPNGDMTGWEVLQDKWFPLQEKELSQAESILHAIMSKFPARIEDGRIEVLFRDEWCDMNMHVCD